MAKTSILALLFVLGSHRWQVSTLPVLTPSTILTACPGDEVVMSCYEPETTANMRISLRWQITLMDRSIPVIEVALNNQDGNTSYRQEAGLEFYAEWTSYSPLSAILTTTAHSALNGATVTCAVGRSASQGPLIISVTQILLEQPEIQWLNITGGWFETDNLTAIIEWELKGNSDCLDFTISLTSPTDISSGYNVTTRNKNHTFIIFYNTNYTVTVSCSHGNKTSKTFNFDKCELSAGECVQLSSGTDVYTIINDPSSTAVTDRNGYPIMIVALAVGIPLILPCLCLVGTTAAVLSSSLVVKRKRGSSKQEDKQSAEDSQNRENHTIEHWGIYSLLAQPDQAGSTRNSAVYAEIGSKAIISPEGKKGKKEKKGARVVMPDTNVQYAVVKKKPQSTPEQQEQRAIDLDMNIVLHLDQLLLKLCSQVSPKWRQFGFAVRVPVETLNELTSYQEEQRLSEIAGYWMKQHQDRLTWREVARIMKEIDLNDLAEEILNDSIGDAEENETTQHYHTVAELSSTHLSDEPAKTDTDDNNATTIQDT